MLISEEKKLDVDNISLSFDYTLIVDRNAFRRFLFLIK